MPDKSTSTIVGWTLSFVLYFIVLAVGIIALQSSNEKTVKYTAKKNLLNVTLVERKNEKKVQKKKKKVVKKKDTINKPKPKPEKKVVRTEKSNTPAAKPLKNLFDNIDLSELPEEKKERKKVRKKIVQKEYEEVVKSEKAKKIAKSLEFEEQEQLIITQNDGIYDEFRGKIQDILDENWQETVETVSGNEAKVIVGIDKFGNFSYKIETLSYNDAFNAKLRDFLEEMKDLRFPAYMGGEIFHMSVVFKDILE